MKLESVSIRGFRSIAELSDLSVGAPTLLTGHNDAGKTSILDAVRFLLNEYSASVRDATYALTPGGPPSAGETVRPDPRRVETTSVEGTFVLSDGEQDSLQLASPLQIRRRSSLGSSAIYEIKVPISDEPLLRDYAGLLVAELKSRVESLGLETNGTTKAALLEALDVAAAAGPSSLRWAAAPAPVIKVLPRVLRFNPSGSTDAEDSIRTTLQTAYKAHLEVEDVKKSISTLEEDLAKKLVVDAEGLRKHIMLQCPDIGDVQIVPVVSFDKGLRSTQVSVKNSDGEDVHLGEAGAGRARRVSLAVWEYNTGLLGASGDVVLLYDEPDTHLDYAHQREFMSLVRKQAELPNVRMLIATHSMNMIDGIDIADVVHVRHVANRTVADVLVDDSEIGRHLGAVAASLGLRNTVLLHERLFVGVEGETEAQAFPVLFKLAKGQQLESAGIALWPCNGNDGALKFAAFLVKNKREVVFVVDRDSLTNAKHIFSKKAMAGYALTHETHAEYLGEPDELEDLFSNFQWVTVANESWPRVDGVKWTEEQVQEHRGGKFSSQILDLFKNGSLSGPPNKQTLVTTLALSLTEASDVPAALVSVFDALISRATDQPVEPASELYAA